MVESTNLLGSSLETETGPRGVLLAAASDTKNESLRGLLGRGGGEHQSRISRDENEALLDTETDHVRARPLSCDGGSLVTRNDDDGEHRRPSSATSPSSSPTLPLPLRVLFGCNGITLALPSTALMYIVNTRVALPLSLLPAYAAVAFLPFALKPLYAVANHWLAPPSKEDGRDRRRHLLLSCLLLLNSATLLATYGARDVPSCFAWAFARGATSAWAEFVLGLALLSRVRAAPDVRDSGDGSDNRPAATAAAAESRSVAASCFQAQAAAARGVGSLLSYAFTAVYFGVRVGPNNDNNNKSRAVNEADVWNLLAVAAGVHVAGSVLALACRVGSTPSKGTQSEPPRRCCFRRTTTLLRAATAQVTRSHDASYHSISTEAEDDARLHNGDDFLHQEDELAVVETDAQPVDTATSTSSFSINTALMIGSLQVALVLMTVREPIVSATTPGVWWCGWIACVTALMGSGVYRTLRDGGSLPRSRQNHRHNPASHRVGLFLLLRHAAPSCSYLVESYLYVLLREHPVVLQVLAVHGSAMTTLAAWSYGRRFGASLSTQTPSQPSPRGENFEALVRVIVITTVAASLVSLSQLCYVYNVAPPPMVPIIVPQLGVIFIVNSLTTIADEWMFLPDVILATLAVVVEDDTPPSGTGTVDGYQYTGSSPLLPRREETPNVGTRIAAPHSLERDLKYGSLVSCIDFGGQLGSLLTGPLIAVLRVTRDDDNGRWVHLERLIVATAVISIMTLPLLLLLPGVTLSAICRSRRRPLHRAS